MLPPNRYDIRDIVRNETGRCGADLIFPIQGECARKRCADIDSIERVRPLFHECGQCELDIALIECGQGGVVVLEDDSRLSERAMNAGCICLFEGFR